MQRRPAALRPGAGWWLPIFSVFVLLVAGSCVETAECNESVSCPEGEVCYRYDCRPRCEESGDCPEGTTCRSCQPASGDNRCFGIGARACVATEDASGG